MLLKNFHKWLDSHGSQTAKTYVRCDGNSVELEYKSVNTTNFKAPFKVLNGYGKMITGGITGYEGTRFGSGTTPPTGNDYRLENDIGESITVATPSAVSVTETDTYIEYSATFGVTAKETVNISEVGLFMGSFIMVERTVLDTPITIPAGQSKPITYAIRMNYPPA